MAAEWGRKETIMWPPHSPVHTYGAAALALLLTCIGIWCHFTFATEPLQQYYTPIYFRSGLERTSRRRRSSGSSGLVTANTQVGWQR